MAMLDGRWMHGVLAALVPLGLTAGQPGPSESPAREKPPVVLFPAFHFTKLQATVRDQTTAPGCPRSGTFQDWFRNDRPSRFSQICRDRLLTLRYRDDPSLPMPERFAEQPGVTVE
ncbi:hypothetical protein, partial [Nonomuraea angiospora]